VLLALSPSRLPASVLRLTDPERLLSDIDSSGEQLLQPAAVFLLLPSLYMDREQHYAHLASHDLADR
jgi:hypothetical protein